MKKLAIVWGITVLLVFGGLTFFGFKYQEIKDYKKLESKMVFYAKKYIDEKEPLNLKNGEEYKISLTELKVFRPKVDFNVKTDTCDGKVIVTKVFWGYSYKASLKCKNY